MESDGNRRWIPFCRSLKCRKVVQPTAEGCCPECGGAVDRITEAELVRSEGRLQGERTIARLTKTFGQEA